MKSAVLLLIFNRPSTTSRVFDAIREAQPKTLYVAADGPRKGLDAEHTKVQEARRIATAIDWDCDLKTLFRDENIGCRDAVTQAIDWFFENEDSGLIFEDDCLPSQTFFQFCDEMLNRYQHDKRIWQVSGYNPISSVNSSMAGDYLYSAYGSIWGWATWRDRWASFKSSLAQHGTSELLNFAIDAIPPDEFPERRRLQLARVVHDQRNIWDFQWFFARLINSGLSVVPQLNQIENIGFGSDATHTFTSNPSQQPERHALEFPLVPPPCVLRDRKRDLKLLEQNYAGTDSSLIAKFRRLNSRFRSKLVFRKW